MNDVGTLPGLLLASILFGLGLVVLSATGDDRATVLRHQKLFAVAFILRFAVSALIYVFGFVGLLGDEDASGWLVGASLARDWAHRSLSLADLPGLWSEALLHPMGNRGYQYLVASLFFSTGTTSRLMAAVLNNFFGAMAVVLSARVGAKLFSSWVGTRVGWFACLLPSLVVWSSQTLKEPVVIFLETIALYACVRLRGSDGGLRYVVLCAAAILALVGFRFYAAYVTATAIFLSLVLPQLGTGRTRVGAAVSISALVIPVLVLTGALARHEVTLQAFPLERLQSMRDWTALHTGSGVPLGYDLSTPSGIVGSVAVGSVHLLLAPFPWQLGGASLRSLLTFPEMILWWFLFFFGFLPGLRIAIRARFSQVQPLLYFVAGMSIVYGANFSNVGLVFRQRAQLMPWLLVFAMVGFEQRAVRALVLNRHRSAFLRRLDSRFRGPTYPQPDSPPAG